MATQPASIQVHLSHRLQKGSMRPSKALPPEEWVVGTRRQ